MGPSTAQPATDGGLLFSRGSGQRARNQSRSYRILERRFLSSALSDPFAPADPALLLVELLQAHGVRRSMRQAGLDHFLHRCLVVPQLHEVGKLEFARGT